MAGASLRHLFRPLQIRAIYIETVVAPSKQPMNIPYIAHGIWRRNFHLIASFSYMMIIAQLFPVVKNFFIFQPFILSNRVKCMQGITIRLRFLQNFDPEDQIKSIVTNLF